MNIHFDLSATRMNGIWEIRLVRHNGVIVIGSHRFLSAAMERAGNYLASEEWLTDWLIEHDG